MLRITHVIKPWKESGALNAHINLYGFWNQGIFLTKSGDLGLVLKVRGVDYGTRHRTKNNRKVLLAVRGSPSRHELHPPLRAVLDQAGNSLPNTELGARHFRR